MAIGLIPGELRTSGAPAVRDPARRLPDDWQVLFPRDLGGTLYAPDRGVPIHPGSIRTFAAALKPGRAACYVPQIPVTSSLPGMPGYQPILYWAPPGFRVKDVEAKLRYRYRRLRGRSVPPMFVPTGDLHLVTETGREEQVHYFATHFRAIAPRPQQVSVVLSNLCNLKCVMCPYHSPEIKPTHTTDFFEKKEEMTWEMMQTVAREAGKLGVPVKMGNIEEPLIHDKIVEFVRLCRESGVPHVHTTTNGLPLTEKMGRELIDAGISSVYISMDASRPDTYKRVRGANLVKLEENVRRFVKQVRASGKAIRVMTSFVRNKGVGVEEQVEFMEKWTAETDGAIFYNLAEYDDGNSRFDRVNKVATDMMAKAGGRWACVNPFQEIYVLPDGRVYYCCETVSKLAFAHLESMGDYPKQTLADVWLGEAFTRLRRDLILNELEGHPGCKDCGIWMAHAVDQQVEEGVRVTRNMCTEIFEPLRSPITGT